VPSRASKQSRTPGAGGPSALGGLDSSSSRPVAEVSDLRLLRAIDELEARLREVGDPQRAARLVARAASHLLGADGVCIALLKPGDEDAMFLQTGLDGSSEVAGAAAPARWDRRLLADFARGRKIDPPANIALARLKRRARPWGTLAVRWNRAEPGWDARNAVTKLAAAGNLALEAIERHRLAEVRARIDKKIMEQLRPKDLFYQILDGLRSLTGYDHTGMLLRAPVDAADASERELEVAAEQIAWRKGKSRRIGARVAVSEPVWAALGEGRAWGFSRESGDRWSPWDPLTPAALTASIGRGLPVGEAEAGAAAPPAEEEVIIAPLIGPAGVAAVLRISARHAGTFGLYECDLVTSLLPQAMVAIHNAERTESLQDRVLQAERKHAIAELARGVSHDVNNALGSMLPLIQQLREEAADGRIDPATLAGDLAQIEHSVHVCTRIFGGMLKFARHASSASATARARVDLAIDSVLTLLADGMDRRGIRVHRDAGPLAGGDAPAAEPPVEVPIRQSELEQVLLNLLSNARDALASGEVRCADGAAVHIRVRRVAIDTGAGSRPAVQIEVEDTGPGVPEHERAMVFEPFFTTKASGSGLGLSVCRSIVWAAQGRIELHSPARSGGYPPGGPGCRVVVTMPLVPD
jgi:signal transduction histidine kinase